MAWEARWGLKLLTVPTPVVRTLGLNGLGSPLGIETKALFCRRYSLQRLNGLGSPLGIETVAIAPGKSIRKPWLNGLGSPLGIETKDRGSIMVMRHPGLNGLGSPLGIETPHRGINRN